VCNKAYNGSYLLIVRFLHYYDDEPELTTVLLYSRLHRGPIGDHRGPTGDHRGPTGDHRGPIGDQLRDHRGPTGDRLGPTGDRQGTDRGPTNTCSHRAKESSQTTAILRVTSQRASRPSPVQSCCSSSNLPYLLVVKQLIFSTINNLLIYTLLLNILY
jgi:hypothetical protein